MIGVMIVDDSAVVRQTMTMILSGMDDMRVVAAVRDPLVAMEALKRTRPDVIILDLEMPRMGGLEFLRYLRASDPIPVVICSGITDEDPETAIAAIESGAAEVITKPRVDVKKFLEDSRIQIGDAIRAARQAKPAPVKKAVPRPLPKLNADAVLAAASGRESPKETDPVVVVGASTGGTEALRIFLEAMPADAPGIVIVQHMPEHFTKAFADRLDRLCRVEVREAKHLDRVGRGLALVAPGGRHTMLKRIGSGYAVEVIEGDLVNRHRPSVDVLFRSASRFAGANAIGVIMTGMGDDGAAGMLEMHEQGSVTIAQDEESCVVFGMPREAIALGGVDKVLPLDALPGAVLLEASARMGG